MTTQPANAAAIAAGDVGLRPKHKSGYVSGTILHIGKRKYDMKKITLSSSNRFQQVLNSEQVTTEVEFEDNWLTPTVYFQFYSNPVVIHTKVYAK